MKLFLKVSSDYIFVNNSSPINITLPFEIYINEEDNKNHINIGYNRIIYFKSDYNDKENNFFNDSNIEENTHFYGWIGYTDMTYRVKELCYLWKNEESEVFIFCNLNRNISSGFHVIEMYGGTLHYSNKDILIKTEVFSTYIYQLQGSFPFLYSNKQTIDIEEEPDIYYLKFNLGLYQNEKLILINESFGYIILDECSTEKKELICKIGKSELEEIPHRRIKSMIYFPSSIDKGPLIQLPMIGEIFINYKLPKIDLKINIIKSLENHFDQNNYIAYEVETNITNISNIVSETFQLDFEETNGTQSGECYFKKTYENPMYLLCILEKGNYTLSEIKNEIKLIDKNIKY